MFPSPACGGNLFCHFRNSSVISYRRGCFREKGGNGRSIAEIRQCLQINTVTDAIRFYRVKSPLLSGHGWHLSGQTITFIGSRDSFIGSNHTFYRVTGGIYRVKSPLLSGHGTHLSDQTTRFIGSNQPFYRVKNGAITAETRRSIGETAKLIES